MQEEAEVERARYAYDVVCDAYVRRRAECWAQSLRDRGGEDCLVQELEEKQCLAWELCPTAARRFYGKRANLQSGVNPPTGSKGLCSLWAESFAFSQSLPEGHEDRVLHEAARERVQADRKKLQRCRKRSLELSRCLGTYLRHSVDSGQANSAE